MYIDSDIFSTNSDSSLLNEETSEDAELDRLLGLASINLYTDESYSSDEKGKSESLKRKKQKKGKPEKIRRLGEPFFTFLPCSSSEKTHESIPREIRKGKNLTKKFYNKDNNWLSNSKGSSRHTSGWDIPENTGVDKSLQGNILKNGNKLRKLLLDNLQKYRMLKVSEDYKEKQMKSSKGRKERKITASDKEKEVETVVEEKSKKESKSDGDESEKLGDKIVEPKECHVNSVLDKKQKKKNEVLDHVDGQSLTKLALRMEAKRTRRLKERQELMKKLYEDLTDGSTLILDFDPVSKQELVVVDKHLSKHLKPYQREGVRFMWNCCLESLKRIKEEEGSGCMLAHCTGLGKSLQVITFIHSALTHSVHLHKVLIICPLKELEVWFYEFKKWMSGCAKQLQLFDVGTVRNNRLKQINSWIKKGGVLIISYGMFRMLVKGNNFPTIKSNLVDPGPDILVCDEGHLMKDPNSELSRCLSSIRTQRRIVLTGLPLRENIIQYYYMVNFVKPNILGTKKEFMNRFVIPIINGQSEVSTQKDVFIMKERSNVLQASFQTFVQRLGYEVLEPLLPQKKEFVISVSLTETQQKLYRLCLRKTLNKGNGLLKDFSWFHKVWTHPLVVKRYFDQNDIREDVRMVWEQIIPANEYHNLRSSNKLRLLFCILRECRKVGDKVVVFSESMYTLRLIESFLLILNSHCISGGHAEFAERWVLGRDYFKLTTSTKAEDCNVFCEKFSTYRRARLCLVSTKIERLGINLTVANRVIFFDTSWNPAHDLQSLIRVYRFGQEKRCYFYRFIAAFTMEEKIYKRHLSKLSFAYRSLGDLQIERHYSSHNLKEFYWYDPLPRSKWKIPEMPRDRVLAGVLINNRDIIVDCYQQNSLMKIAKNEELTAGNNYEKENASLEGKISRDKTGQSSSLKVRDIWVTRTQEVASEKGHKSQSRFTKNKMPQKRSATGGSGHSETVRSICCSGKELVPSLRQEKELDVSR